ncbi:MAG: hypothetical protein ACON4T_09575 [Synechococcus sp.]
MKPMRLRGSKGSDRERRVFQTRRPRPLPPPWRQAFDGVLMVLLGVGLLAFLAWLPQRANALTLVSEMMTDLINGVVTLLTALLGLALVVLIAGVLLLGFGCLLAGGMRLVHAMVRLVVAPQRSSIKRRRRSMPPRQRTPPRA